MGLYDRDYYRDSPSSSVGGFAMWSVTTWIIVINVAVFVLDGVLTPRDLYGQAVSPLLALGYFSIDKALGGLQLWRFITFQFLHASIGHIFGNMLGLYFFGPMVEQYLGRQRYLIFYLSCGVAGACSFILLSAAHILGSTPGSAMIGASAGVFGVLIAGARLAPDTTVMLLFPPIPMKLKTLAWVMVGIAAYTVFTSGRNAGGEAAHIGGAIWGFLLIRNAHWINWPLARKRPRR